MNYCYLKRTIFDASSTFSFLILLFLYAISFQDSLLIISTYIIMYTHTPVSTHNVCCHSTMGRQEQMILNWFMVFQSLFPLFIFSLFSFLTHPVQPLLSAETSSLFSFSLIHFPHCWTAPTTTIRLNRQELLKEIDGR